MPGTIPGDGNVLSAFTDARDVGKFVVKTIVDPRTINRSLFCYSEMLSMNQVYDVLDKTTGRRYDRNYVRWPIIHTSSNVTLSLTEMS